MLWFELIPETLRSVRAHATRFGLTSLGVFWGVMMLTFLTANQLGYDQHFGDMVHKIGQRIVYLFSGAVSKGAAGERATRVITFEEEDVARASSLDSVEQAAANLWLGHRVFRVGSRSKLLWTYGGDEHTLGIRNFEVAEGRGFAARDIRERREVVFLGQVAAQRLFGEEPAVGRRVTIDSTPFRVIGVSRHKGEQLVGLGPRDDELAIIPVTTGQRWMSRDDNVGNIIMKPVSREASYGAIEAARALIALHLGFEYDDDSAVGSFNVQEVLDILEGILFGLKLFLIVASCITLFVGAAGVMNIMLVVVSERTREIGLRKAIGASNGAIFAQFLAESLCVTMISGVLGIGVGTVMALGLARYAAVSTVPVVPPVIVPEVLFAILAVIVVVGVAAGLLPAMRAARIEPAVSLRA